MTGSSFEKLLLSPEGNIGAAVAFSSILEYIQDRMKPADITDLIMIPEDELNSANSKLKAFIGTEIFYSFG